MHSHNQIYCAQIENDNEGKRSKCDEDLGGSYPVGNLRIGSTQRQRIHQVYSQPDT